MKTQKILYWIATALLSLMFLGSATMYFVKNADVTLVFENLGFPTWIIYPLAICKIGAVAVILSNKGGALKQWAYAGLFFNTTLAFFAHYMVGDGEEIGALIAMVLLLSSYFLGKNVRP
ncbi:MAG: DoxX family protein [Maribacter sp.]|uniref:DoxX family protein n=1 Tax=Maribacter sp. TaxID=1897614 RepID=UPI003296EA8F